MFKVKFIILTTCLFYSCKILAQNDSTLIINPGKNIIFSYNQNESEGGFLIPFIESALTQLKVKQTDQHLFKEVGNLNILLDERKISTKLASAYLQFDRGKTNTSFTSSKSRDSIERTIVSKLNGFDFLMEINIRALNNLLEYQFTIFKIVNSQQDVSIDPRSYRATSIFIDPSTNTYKNTLKVALKQLLHESNVAPIPLIIKENRQITDTLYFEVDSTIKLEAFQIDYDSPEDQISYHWDVIRKWYFSRQIALANPNNKIQEIKFFEPGNYDISLTVNDGISSVTKKILIVVEPKPYLEIKGYSNKGFRNYANNDLYFYSFDNKLKEDDENIINMLSVRTDGNSVKFYYIKHDNFRDTSSWIPLKSSYLFDVDAPQPFRIERTDSINASSTIYKLELNRDIPIPSDNSIGIISERNGIIEKQILSYKWRKLSQFMPSVEAAGMIGKKDTMTSNTIFVSMGFDYIFKRMVLNPMIGLVIFPVSEKYKISPDYSYKLNLILNIYAKNYFNVSLLGAYMNHPVLVGSSTKIKTRINSGGLGVQVGIGSHLYDYKTNYDGTKVFFIHYTSQRGERENYINQFQLGVRNNWIFQKKRR